MLQRLQMHKLITISLFITLCLGACVPGHNDYSEFTNISADGWPYNQPLTFIPVVADSVCTGTMTITIRHGNAYPYRNIWLEICHQGESGAIAHDTINMELADIYGRWHGSGLGTDFQYTDTLGHSFRLYRDSHIRIRHIMRNDTLPSIEQVGIEFIADKSR
jgi:gliding motility-associated lipoprotein GldH